jgi:hypothetical protein
MPPGSNEILDKKLGPAARAKSASGSGGPWRPLRRTRGDPGIQMPGVCISVNASASDELRGEAGPYASSPASHAGYITSADGT